MARYLVTFTDQVDDIEINGFKVMSDKEIDQLEELASSITWNFNVPIGNLKLEYADGEDYLSKLDYKELTFDENKSLKKIFNDSFGFFIGEDFFEKIVKELDESDEAEDDYFDKSDGDIDFYSDDERDDYY
jgi:hypothetical protein